MGYKVNAGQEPAQPPKPAQAIPAGFDDDRRVIDLKAEVKALTDRLDKLEAKLGLPAKEVLAEKPTDPRARDNVRLANAAETPPFKIQSRFEALVETVFVKPGQEVKKGDPIVTFQSFVLTSAVNECQTKFVQWDHDKKLLAAHEPMAKEGRITQMVWVENLNNEKKSWLDYLVARQKLGGLGMQPAQIQAVLEEFNDHSKKERKAEDNTGLVRLTITAPFDATVTECHVEANDWTEPKDLLFLLKARDH